VGGIWDVGRKTGETEAETDRRDRSRMNMREIEIISGRHPSPP